MSIYIKSTREIILHTSCKQFSTKELFWIIWDTLILFRTSNHGNSGIGWGDYYPFYSALLTLFLFQIPISSGINIIHSMKVSFKSQWRNIQSVPKVFINFHFYPKLRIRFLEKIKLISLLFKQITVLFMDIFSIFC